MREEGNKKSSQFRVAFKNKKWLYPALYVTGAALLLIAALMYQLTTGDVSNVDQTANSTKKQASDHTTVEVGKKEEVVKMPVALEEDAVVVKKFYDAKASTEEKEAALVFYNNTYTPNLGVDIAMKDNKSFDVLAAMSGVVTSTVKDPVLGNCVTIEHDNGYVTFYQSLDTVAVEPGSVVKQGQIVATSGLNLLNPDAGAHVHFEIRKNNKPINPELVMNKPLSTLGE